MASTTRKLTDVQVDEIRAAMQARRDNNPKRLAAKFGVGVHTIYSIANGRRYKHPHPTSEE